MLKKYSSKISSYLLVILGILGLILSIADVFMDLSLLIKDPSIITLLLLSGLTISIGLERIFSLKSITSKIEEIGGKHDSSYELLEIIHSHVAEKKIDDIRSFIESMPSGLKLIVDDKIKPLIEGLNELVVHKKITITIRDQDIFKIFFKNVLKDNPSSTFVATSLPTKDYFWDDDNFFKKMADFVEGGGEIKRIFFLESEDSLKDQEVIEVLTKHRDSNVEVYTLVKDSTLEWEYYHPFFTDVDGSLGWEANLDSQSIKKITITANEKTIDNYNTTFTRLIEEYDAKPFS